jgi:hypothetical protein
VTLESKFLFENQTAGVALPGRNSVSSGSMFLHAGLSSKFLVAALTSESLHLEVNGDHVALEVVFPAELLAAVLTLELLPVSVNSRQVEFVGGGRGEMFVADLTGLGGLAEVLLFVSVIPQERFGS